MPSLLTLLHMRRKSDAPPPSTRTTTESPEEVADRLAYLNLRQQQQPPVAHNDAFVGGFHPAAVGGNGPYGGPRRPTVAPSFPVAQAPPHHGPPPVPYKVPDIAIHSPDSGRGMSRTMGFALAVSAVPGVFGPPRPSANNLQRPQLDVASRPHSDPMPYTTVQAEKARSGATLPLFSDSDDQLPLSVPPKPSARSTSTNLQVSISHPPGRSVSSPAVATSSPSDLPDKVTCSGFTKTKKPRQCRRQTDRSVLSLPESNIWYCHQHRAEMLGPATFRLATGHFDYYALFIPEYLSPDARAALRREMTRPISEKDGEGYIYVFQYRDKNNANQDDLLFKAGRTNNPKSRNGQWSKQCPSMEHHIAHVHPPSEDGNAASLMVADLNPGPPGICCHRLETLVLTELADLARYQQYLHPEYQVELPKLKLRWEHLEQTVRDRQSPTRAPCKDCGRSHRELFTFPRIKSGPYVGQELERVIIPVINRWADFLCLLAMRDE
ncbi:uncharacterized protein C8Q71DRAFT_733379 [Rhodofomes roseus]|uniref:Bacteriophage T5 Orf172 DNA-binding domain-containing protein n=1 Tax=Rhodofomes roseus TaxID=34475 RepID=A0ABQ8KV44_9APHY|nr:uncharacterized protein C8Q71DRAFT_733379 [Rhodofomes roseus]KAH9842548.1 hypothetical protein C8Q71DRAFT_733379 [Rhodofomes roseus]